MSLSNLSDSQNVSKTESLLSERSNSVTETDPIFYSSASENSINSRPPQNIVVSERQISTRIPIVDLSDENSLDVNDENQNAIDEPDPDQEPNPGQNTPKIYHHFLNEVVRYSSSSNFLSDEDKPAVEWLREQEPIECSALLENEDDPAGLQTLLGNMPPKTMDEADAEAGSSSLQRKKQKINDEGLQTALNPKTLLASTTQTLTNKQTDTNPVLTSVDKWWCLFNDFDGAPNSDATSIFDRRFPIESIVEKHLNRKEDRARVNKVGLRNVGRPHGKRTEISLSLKNKELTEKLKLAEADMKKAEKLKTDLVSCEKKNNELIVEKATWDEKYSKMEKAYQDAETGKKALEEANKSLERTVTTLTAENNELVAWKDLIITDLEDAKAQVAMQHAAGFEKVVSQLQIPIP
ncbi:hypothetical protein SESBI_21660 [Sesbania bispinosa]|nr:hypothetical protein SESBI_21660 [Sesbania bispinosa]